MSPTFDVVAVAENTPYLMWQAMLFHYSCLRHTGRAPIITVHGDGAELLPGFRRIEESGGRLQRLPDFRRRLGPDYPVLNTVGTLRHVESEADYLVLCDSDLVFLGPPPLERLSLDEDQVSFDAVDYLQVDARRRSFLERPCRRAGVELERLKRFEGRGGVPHVVPRSLRRDLGHEWLRCTSWFVPAESSRGARCELPWESLMWSLILAAVRLDVRPVTTRLCLLNHEGSRLVTAADGRASLLHYCYGDEEFDKRRYRSEREARGVWGAGARPGSLNDLVCAQLREAGAFYGELSARGRRELAIAPASDQTAG